VVGAILRTRSSNSNQRPRINHFQLCDARLLILFNVWIDSQVSTPLLGFASSTRRLFSVKDLVAHEEFGAEESSLSA
jgi:hypothetical protein